MKSIALTNWYLLGIYTAILLGLIVFAARSGSSGDSMASGYLIMMLIPLGILAAINLINFRFAHIFVLAVNIGVPVMGLVITIARPIVMNLRKARWDREDDAMANGTYYFKDASRQQLAADIAALNAERLREDFKQPISNLNEAGTDNVTLFDFAATKGLKADPDSLIRCFQVLLENGAKIDNGDPKHSPTHLRVLQYNTLLLEWFLKNGADPNAKELDKHLPLLYLAITQNSADQDKIGKVRLLLEHGANPDLGAPNLEKTIYASPLLSAVEQDDWEIANLLIAHGADTSYQTESGWNIHVAIDATEKLFANLGETPPKEFSKLAETVRKSN